MIRKNVGIVRIKPRLLRAAAEEPAGVPHDELIQRRSGGREDRHRGSPPPSGAARLLPEGIEGAGEARHHRGVQAPDVDAQLQGVGGHHPLNTPLPQAPLYLPALVGEEPAPVRLHADMGIVRVDIGQVLVHVRGGHFGLDPRMGEEDGLDPRFEEGQHPAAAFGNHAAADSLRRVHQGRVVEDDPPLPPGRAVPVHQADLLPDECLRQFLGVGDGGGAEDELRLGAVKGGDPPQPPDHVGRVAPQNAPVGVGFVNHHEFQPGEKLDPLGMVGQYARVEHIGVGDDDPALVPRGHPQAVRRVPVVHRGFDRQGFRRARGEQFTQFSLLILGQGLGGKEVEGPGRFVRKQGLERGQVVAEGLPRRGGRYHDRMAARLDEVPDFPLMAVYPLDTPAAQRPGDTPVQVRGQGRVDPVLGGKQAVFHDVRRE